MPNNSQNENLLNKKRRSQNSNNEEENKINIISINGLKIPKKKEDDFIVNITYKLNNDNISYIDDFNFSDKRINRKYLNKYMENILFNNNKGRNIKKKLIFKFKDI